MIGVALLTKQAYPVPAQPYHCARDAEWPWNIRVVHVDGANLTANNILSADLPELACRNLQVGEKISAMGYPSAGQTNTLFEVRGEIIGGIGPQFLYPAALPTTQGMSGGPVWTSADEWSA